MKKLTSILFVFIFLIGCAPIPQSYEPIIDMRDASVDWNWNQYYQDLHECRTYATRICPADQAVGEAIAGAAFGAALGAILGSGTGDAGGWAGIGAGSGGLSGAAHGAGNAIEEQKRIIRNCMRGRGYKVLE